MKKSSWLNINLLLGVSVVMLVLVGPALLLLSEPFGHPQITSDIGNIAILFGFVGVFVFIIQKVLKRYENALLSTAVFFQASDKKLHRLLSIRVGFVYFLLCASSLLFVLIIWYMSSRFFWAGYVVWLFSLLGLFGGVLLVLLFITNRLLWIFTPYKSMLYKWETFDGSDQCHECGGKGISSTYGVFSVTMRKNHSTLHWLFYPRWGYERWMSVCSVKCREIALKKYADSVSNL